MAQLFERKRKNISELETWLYAKRMLNHKTCRQLAKILGMERTEYYYLETGKRRMKDVYLEKISKLYNEDYNNLKKIFLRDEVLKAARFDNDPEMAAAIIADLNKLLNS